MAKRKLPSGIEMRGNVYWSNIQHKGQRIRRSLGHDLASAQVLLAEIRTRLSRGDFGLSTQDGDYLDAKNAHLRVLRQKNRSVEQPESSFRKFEAFFCPSKLSEITPDLIHHWRDVMTEEKLSPRTINRHVGEIRHLMRKCVQSKRLERDPLSEIHRLPEDSPRKVRRAMTPDELQRFLAECAPAWKPLFTFLAHTGCRRNEAASLLWSDVDLSRCEATIRASVAKNRRPRTVPLDQDLIEMLQPIAAGQGLVFATEGGTKRRHNAGRAFQAACKRAGIADGAKPKGSLDIHALRVTFATILLDGGANPKDVQEILGHRTLDMTMRIYARSSSSRRLAAVQLIRHSFATEDDKKSKTAEEKSKNAHSQQD